MSKSNSWLLALFALAVAGAVWPSACESWLLRRARAATLRVGLQDSPPWYFVESAERYRGPAVDLVNNAAARLGLRVQWVVQNQGPDAAFERGEVDLWPLAGRLPSRLARLPITDAWMELPYWLVLDRRGEVSSSPRGQGLTLAARNSALTLQFVQEHLPDASILPVSSHFEALQAVCRGDVPAAVVVESVVLQQSGPAEGSLCVDRDIHLTTRRIATIGFGVASRPGSPEARAAAQAIAREIATMTADGTLTSVMLRWGYSSGEIRAFQERAKTVRFSRLLLYLSAALAISLFVLIRYFLKLRAARQRLDYQSQLLAQTNDAILALDHAGSVTYWNRAAETLFGAAESAILGRPAASVLPPDLLRVIHARETGDLAFESSGRRLYLQVTSSVLLDRQKRPMGLVAIVHDLTHMRDLEERYRASQRIESLGRLAGGVAHDFNNLLTVILGWGQLLLQRTTEQGTAAAPVRHILHAAEQASQLTQQLLAFGRRQILQPRPLDLNSAVSQVVSMLRRVLEAPVRLQVQLAPEPLPVKADPGQLSQVILNLALNARDAMPEGGEIHLHTALTSRDGIPHARLTLSDTGKGMDESTRARIFEPFFTTKEQGRGTGLGLATVHGIVHQSGGAITVESEPGAGSTFTVYLPLTTEPLSEEEPAAGIDRQIAARRVLIAEDEPGVLDYLTSALTHAGIEVTSASGLPQVRSLIDNGLPDFDLLLTDVVMPGGSGPELARLLRQRRPGIKVLYMSGYSQLDLLRDELARPGVAYLQKPFQPAALLASIDNLLGIPP